MQNFVIENNGFPVSRKWKAKWIWGAGGGKEKNTFYYFRKRFTLDSPPADCRLYIAADTRYQLFVNGHFMGRGAPQSQPFLQYYDERDISGELKTGDNCIAVIVNHIGNMADARGGLLAEIVDGKGETVLSTGSDWRILRSAAWAENTYCVHANKATPYQEFYDARKAPAGWMDADFDDSEWPRATVIRGWNSDRPPAVMPWSRLIRRDIPYMTADSVPAERIEKIEESLDLMNRSRPLDLAPGLSMTGNPIQYSRVENPGNLCSEDGGTVIQCSLNHLDLNFDGIYAPAIVLDFGRVITARAELRLNGTDGGMVDIGYAERLIDGHFNIAMECEFADRYYMKDGEQTFQSFTWKAFRYLKLRFRNCFEPVALHSVRGIVSTYPYEERGGFSSEDEELNTVFNISRETVRLCSNEFLMDTPWREQAQWLGDVALVTLPAIYACFGDTLLPGKFLRQAGANQHPTGMISNISNMVNHNWQRAIPDYSLWWITGLWNHYMFTGEEEWIHRLYPQALRVIRAHLDYVNERGLIEDMPFWVFVDWASVDKHGESAAYNAIFYGALETVSKMAEIKSDAYTKRLSDNAMTAIKSVFQKRFFAPERGCLADACVDGELTENISEHANFAAIYWQLCDDKTAKKIISAFYEEKTIPKYTEAQPFFMTVVLKALDHAGRFDLAVRLIRERWGKRMAAKGATSAFEEWYQNGSWRSGGFTGFLRSHSHAWSACPAEFLIRNLMGLEILEPGCGKIRLAPKETLFDYRAVFPTPRGAIAAERKSGALDIRAPAAVEITGPGK